MEFRLTLNTLVIGSLTVCLSMVVAAWVLDQLRRILGHARSETARQGDWLSGNQRDWTDRKAWQECQTGFVGTYDASQSSGLEPGRGSDIRWAARQHVG